MNLRSHVDPCQFIRSIYAPPGAIANETLAELVTAAPRDRERLFSAWRKHVVSNPRLAFHETYHYWQGLRLPFLFWYAVDVNRKMLLVFRELARTGKDWSKWEAVVPEFFYLGISHLCSNLGDKGFRVGGRSAEAASEVIYSVILSPLDLLEGATSFAEWQVFTPTLQEAVNPMSFNRWCKRNASYTSAYKFAARAVGDLVAVSCFSHLVAASFESNRPVHTFVGLLANLAGQVRDGSFRKRVESAPPGSVNWNLLFSRYLDTAIEFEADADAEFGIRAGQPYFRLTLANWVQGSFNDSGYGHPFLSLLARKWADLAAREPVYHEVITSFRWMDKEVWETCWAQFQPPLTIARFDLADGSSRVLAIDAQNGGMDLRGLEVADILTMFSIVKAATGAFMSEGQRLCAHDKCPHFATNQCNSYPGIPMDFTHCAFPQRAKALVEMIGAQ